MTRVRVSLLLVCCLSVSLPALAAPGAALPLLPSGEVIDTTIAFSWQAVPESTWYLFWLGKGTPPSFVMEQWYSAEQAGCANGGVCTITLTPPIGAGDYVWFVQTWGAGASGPWSVGKVFVMRNPTPGWGMKLPDTRRFTLVLEGSAVLDHETGLVWQRAPTLGQMIWGPSFCAGQSINGRYGWRLPAIAELSSLLNGGSVSPALPAGHPFDLGGPFSLFWSETSSSETSAYIVQFGNGVGSSSKSNQARNWCVRGPGGVKQ